MRREIRDLKAGIRSADNGNCYLQIYRTDSGIHILNIDMYQETIYHWVVGDEKTTLTVESIFANPDKRSIES